MGISLRRNKMLALEPCNRTKKYKLVISFIYKDVVVPKGYKTDGLTYKFRLLGIFLNKYDPRFIKAAVVHDYLCDKEKYSKADQYFRELLPPVWYRETMVLAAKVWHFIRYGVKF
jgi:hypothetical protein